VAREDEVLEEIKGKFNLADNYRSTKNLEDKWERWYKIYRCIPREDKPEGYSNIFVPFPYSVIESIVPRIVNAIFAAEPFVTVVPRESGDIQRAKIIEKLLSYQFFKTGFFAKAIQWIKDVCIFGIGILKVTWDFNEDNPKIELVAPWNFYPSPTSKTGDIPWCIHRTIVDIDKLRKAQERGIYRNVEKIEPGGANINDYQQFAANDDEVKKWTEEEKKKKVEILEYWEKDRVVTIANREIVLRDEPNRFAHKSVPFICVPATPVPHEFYGIGYIEPIEYLSYELNDIRNQRMDNANMFINNMWLVNRNAGINYDDLVARPGQIIRGDDISPNGIREVRAALNPQFFAMEESSKRDMQDATGMYDYARGVTPPRGETATAITSLQQMAQIRFQMTTRLIVELGIKPLASMMTDLNQQFITREKIVSIVGDKVLETPLIVEPEHIQGRYDFIPKAIAVDPEVAKPIRRRQLLEFMQIVAPLVANGQLPGFNMLKFVRLVLETFDIKELESLFEEQPPAPAPTPPAGVGSLPNQAGPQQDQVQALLKDLMGRSLTP